MTDRERRAAKYLPFESLKGLKEMIQAEDEKHLVSQKPNLSEDEQMEMNFILFECYSKNQAITLLYYENGIYKEYSGVIQKIDVVNRQILLMPKKKFQLDFICRINSK